MEITLEKIELIKDRTGATYKEAKEALEKANGEVVDAIILLENEIDSKNDDEKFIQNVIDKVKNFVNKGNITKITVKKDGETLVNVPLNAGIIGAVVTPWGVIAATLAAFGFKCQIELQTIDGNTIDVSGKVKDVALDIREKGEVVLDYAKEKTPEIVSFAKEKGEVAWNFAKEKGADAVEFAKEKTPEIVSFAKEKGADVVEFAKEKIEEKKQSAKQIDSIDEIDVDSDVISAEINGEE